MDEDYEVVSSKLLIDENTSHLEAVDKKVLSNMEVEFIDKLSEDYDKIILETNKPLKNYESLESFDKISVEKNNTHGKYVRDNLYDVLEKITTLSVDELLLINHDNYQEHTKDKIRESVKTNDVMIVESIHAIDDLDESTGRLIERLRQWCMPYLPELDKIRNHQLYTKIIAMETTRENIKDSPLLEGTGIILSEDYDIQMDDNDLEKIKSFANALNSLYESKNTLEYSREGS